VSGRVDRGVPGVALLTLALMIQSNASVGAEPVEIGLSAAGELIEAWRVEADSRDRPRVILIGGLDGDNDASRIVADEFARYAAIPAAQRRFELIAIPVANPSASAMRFPPVGAAYRDNADSHVLWRWIGLKAPDLVLIAGPDAAGFSAALAGGPVAGVGAIPARGVAPLAGLLNAMMERIERSERSAAAVELERRLRRTPLELAEELAPLYAQSFERAIYLSGMGLIAHLRLGNVEHVERLAAPFIDGTRDSFDDRRFGLSLYLAGHLVFAELAERTGEAAYLDVVRRAADFAFDADGHPLEAMPEHGEMSDSIFMGASILSAAGRLTGEGRYHDMAAQHIAYMNTHVLREDGLYRHSPLTDAAWGRGNGFAALGYALTLSDFPVDHPQHERLLEEYRRLMHRLAAHQQPDGAWRQVVDHPGAWQETSATAIIGFSMQRGIARGWLDTETFGEVVERAWQAVLARTGDGGVFIDVSESTNKQDSLQAYLHREALFGADERTAGMVMLFATELAGMR
jgi:unsaturated rhamnogalacturonyl hydrolase